MVATKPTYTESWDIAFDWITKVGTKEAKSLKLLTFHKEVGSDWNTKIGAEIIKNKQILSSN